jgi:hypothetical protein
MGQSRHRIEPGRILKYFSGPSSSAPRKPQITSFVRLPEREPHPQPALARRKFQLLSFPLRPHHPPRQACTMMEAPNQPVIADQDAPRGSTPPTAPGSRAATTATDKELVVDGTQEAILPNVKRNRLGQQVVAAGVAAPVPTKRQTKSGKNHRRSRR